MLSKLFKKMVKPPYHLHHLHHKF